jgi:hypothetical protein
MYFVITIDVEPDCGPDWSYSDPLAFEGVSAGIKERLHPLLLKRGAVPTYLVNNVVLEDEASVRTLAGLGGCELGAHLHPEFIAPGKEHERYAGQKGSRNQCNLPPETEFLKISGITDLFKRSFGRAPATFRAGRFGAGPNTIDSLAKLGYKVDTSVTPRVRWTDVPGQPRADFSAAPEHPYFVRAGSLLDEAPAGPILEVPVTISGLPRLFGTRTAWLRPGYSSLKDMTKLAELAVRRSRAAGRPPVLNMMFHNVEALPGKSPYTRTEADCAKFLGDIDSLLAACAALGFRFVKASELYDLLKAG